MLEIEKTDKADSSIHLPDGRISPDKAIPSVAFHLQTRLQADGRNVRRRVSQTGHTAGRSQGPWRPTIGEAEPGLILFQKPLARYGRTIAPQKIKKPHNQGPPRSMTRFFARKRASWEWR